MFLSSSPLPVFVLTSNKSLWPYQGISVKTHFLLNKIINKNIRKYLFVIVWAILSWRPYTWPYLHCLQYCFSLHFSLIYIIQYTVFWVHFLYHLSISIINWWKGKPSGSKACTRKQQPRLLHCTKGPKHVLDAVLIMQTGPYTLLLKKLKVRKKKTKPCLILLTRMYLNTNLEYVQCFVQKLLCGVNFEPNNGIN